MNNMLDPSHLTLHQVRAILQGMARVAHADGDDEREILLMQEFWEACSEEARQHTSLAHARSTPFDATAARAALSIAPLQQTFLAACLLVAYSDGKVSGAEQATIASLIDEVRIDDELVAETHARIKDLLLKRLSRSRIWRCCVRSTPRSDPRPAPQANGPVTRPAGLQRRKDRTLDAGVCIPVGTRHFSGPADCGAKADRAAQMRLKESRSPSPPVDRQAYCATFVSGTRHALSLPQQP